MVPHGKRSGNEMTGVKSGLRENLVGLFDLQDYILDFKRSLKSTRYIRPPAIVKRWSSKQKIPVARKNGKQGFKGCRGSGEAKSEDRRGTEQEKIKTHRSAEDGVQ